MWNNRLKQVLVIVLAFAMLLTGMAPGVSGASQVKADEVSSTATNENIYFLNENNEKVYMDENNTFTLTINDKGRFVAEGVNNPYWDCRGVKVSVTDPNTGNVGSKTHYWVRGNGDFNPYAQESQVDVTLYENGEYGTKKLKFTLKIVKAESPYEELKAYIGNEELSTANPYVVNVADKNTVTFKARKKGETEFSWISPESLNVHEEDTNYGRYDRVNKAFIVLRGDADAVFTVSLQSDDKVKVTFSLTAKKVPMQDFQVKVASEAYIDNWNTLAGNQYIGTSYSVSYTPSNTSNRDLVWENLTPDIAEYSDEVFSNGIVPKKAGTARFRVSSKENPDIQHEVTIEFKYKNPLQKAAAEKDTFNIEKGTIQSFNIVATPADATEQRFNWTYSKEGIVKVTDRIEGSIQNPTERTTYHTLRAIKGGTVTVTGTPIDQTGGCKPIVFTVNVTKGGAILNPVDIDKIVSDGIKSAIDYMDKENADPASYKVGNEWAIITKYRTGQTLSKDILNNYYSSVVKEVSKWKPTQKPTDIAKISLTLSSFGVDITNVGGKNLAEMMYNSPMLQTGSNEFIWCLLAFDAIDYKIPDNARWTREKMVDGLISFQNENGGFGLYNNKGYDKDLTGMAFQALAPYAKEEKVQKSIEKGLDFLRDQLSADYGYDSSETCSQVILGLSALNLDPLENGFGTEENNIFSYFQKKYAVASGGFRHIDKDEEANYMGTYQALEALEAYRRYAAGETAFWDMKDVEKFVPEIKPDTDNSQVKPDTKPGTTASKAETKINKPKRVLVKKAKRSGKKVKVQWKKVNGCTGYQIWTSNKKSGKYTLAKVRKNAGTTSAILKQKKKKKLFVKVRAYKTVGKKTVYGKFSKIRVVK